MQPLKKLNPPLQVGPLLVWPSPVSTSIAPAPDQASQVAKVAFKTYARQGAIYPRMPGADEAGGVPAASWLAWSSAWFFTCRENRSRAVAEGPEAWEARKGGPPTHNIYSHPHPDFHFLPRALAAQGFSIFYLRPRNPEPPG